MSRSYKKHPIIKIAPKDGTDEKRFANKKVRRCKEVIPNGKAYRKLYESWDIHDYICRETYENYNSRYERYVKMYEAGVMWWFNPYKDEHSYYDWYKSYKGK